MQPLNNISINNVKIVATTDQIYHEIDTSIIKNHEVFLDNPLTNNYEITFFSDEKATKNINKSKIANTDSQKNLMSNQIIFAQITAKDKNKNWSGTTKTFLLNILVLSPLLDSNDDGISDYVSMVGYTTENGKIVKWNDNYEKMNFIKYTSDPYRKSTTGDPFSDADKVLGKIDKAVLPEARHPLVAAYPLVGLNLEKIILTRVTNITKEKTISKSEETSNTITHLMSNSSSDSHTLELRAEGIKASTSYAFQHSTTVTKDTSNAQTEGVIEGKSWASSLNMNTSETAFLSGNIRYRNYGTAPIYHALPTVNFVLGTDDSSQTIATIIGKNNTSVNCLLPNRVYPTRDQNPVAWNTSDDFNSQPIKLNYWQVTSIDEGEELQIQTTQTSGYYKKYNLDEEVNMCETQKWEYILNDIYNRTACITVAFKNGDIKQRRIAARNKLDYYNQSQPEITLAEALKISFYGSEVDNDNFVYENITINKKNIIFDQQTSNDIRNDLENKDYFKVKLKQKMSILIYEEELKDIISKKSKEKTDIKNDANIQAQIKKAIDKNPIKLLIGEQATLKSFILIIKELISKNDFKLISDVLPLKYHNFFDKDKIATFDSKIYKDDIITENNAPLGITDADYNIIKGLSSNKTIYYYLSYKKTPNANDFDGIYIPIIVETISDFNLHTQINYLINEAAQTKSIKMTVGDIFKLEKFKAKVIWKLKKDNGKLISSLLPEKYQSVFDQKKISISDQFYYIGGSGTRVTLDEEFLKMGAKIGNIIHLNFSYKVNQSYENFYLPINIEFVDNGKIQQELVKSAKEKILNFYFDQDFSPEIIAKVISKLKANNNEELLNLLNQDYQSAFYEEWVHIQENRFYKSASSAFTIEEKELKALKNFLNNVTVYFYLVYNYKAEEITERDIATADDSGGVFIPININFINDNQIQNLIKNSANQKPIIIEINKQENIKTATATIHNKIIANDFSLISDHLSKQYQGLFNKNKIQGFSQFLYQSDNIPEETKKAPPHIETNIFSEIGKQKIYYYLVYNKEPNSSVQYNGIYIPINIFISQEK